MAAAIHVDREVLRRHKEFLEERMDVDSGLLDKLLANGTLTGKYIRDIRRHQTFDERNARLVDYILQKDKVDCLIASLIDTKQTHLVNYLAGDGEHNAEYGDDWPLGEEQMSILNANQETLVDLLDTTSLIAQMFSAEILNHRQQKIITSEPNVFTKTEILLEIIRRQSLRNYKKTIYCLRATNQSHIAQILEQGGVVVRVHARLNSEEVDETEEEIIARFASVLSGKSLETSSRILEGTLNVIAAKRGQSIVLYIYCKTMKELLHLEEMNALEKLRTIIETIFTQLLSRILVTTVDVENLKNVVESLFNQMVCLKQICQMTVHLSDDEFNRCRAYFPESKFVRAVCDFRPAAMNADEMEEFREWLLNEEVNEETRLISRDYIIDSDEAFDVSQLALCFEKGEQFEIRDLVDVGNDVTWWKAKRLSDGQIGFIPRNRLVIDYNSQQKQKDEIPLSSDLLESNDQLTKNRSTSCAHQTANDLPLELLDIILRKSYLQSIFCEDHVTADQDIIRKMSLVDGFWSHIVNRRKFKKSVWRHLAVVYADTGRRDAIYRNNRHYFQQNIVMHALIRRMRSNDCLTDYEERILFGRRKENQFKAFAHLEAVLKRIDDTRHHAFVLCLRQTHQRDVTKVLENGGVVLKATILSDDIRRSETHKEDVVQRLNALRDRQKRRSRDLEKLISQLRNDNNIELLNAIRDKNPTLFVWCRAQTTLQTMTNSVELRKRLLNILALLPGCQFLCVDGTKDIVRHPVLNIDADQLNKTAMFCSSAISLTSTLDVSEECVIAIAKLDDRICVLCHSAGTPTADRVILAFEDRVPFALKQRIKVPEIRSPYDMGSSRVENCLYVTDLESKSIWKIAGGDYKCTRWLSGMGAPPFTLSLSSEDKLCLTKVGQPLSSLEIYGPDAQLCLRVLLPVEIKEPLHAVETSTGNFVILHRRKMRQKSKDSDGFIGSDSPDAESGNLTWGVSEVTRDGGMVVNWFVPTVESGWLDHPSYLAIDDSEVFVADTRNNRVIQLNSNLTWNKTLISIKRLGEPVRKMNWPKRLHYDEQSKQLLVVGALNGGIHVYTFH